MPTARIDTPGVTVELTANEANITDLGKQAMDMFREATDINNRTPTGPAAGFHNENRWPKEHYDAPGGGGSGFHPVNARETR